MSTFFISNTASFPTAISILNIPPGTVGCENIYPFTVYLSAGNTNQHKIQLYSYNSRSIPYESVQTSKWSQLNPTWRFTDATSDRNIIDNIITTDTPIYSASQVIGVTGYAQFYYIDDMPTTQGNPVYLWTTLEVSGLPVLYDVENYDQPVPGYANSKIVNILPYHINNLSPERLEITRDGIYPLFDLYWMNTTFPVIVSIHGTPGCIVGGCDPILFSYPATNSYGFSGGPMQRGILHLDSSLQTWDPTNSVSYLSAYDENNFPVGGYLRSIVSPLSTSLATTITAGVSVIYDSFFTHPGLFWISSPDNSVLFKIYMPDTINLTFSSIIISLFDPDVIVGTNIINIINTPFIQTISSDPMALSGFGGIFGIAVDPCSNAWCTDGEMDKVFKFNTNGQLVPSATIDLSDYTTYLGTAITGGCTPAGIALDGNLNKWVTLFDSISVLKFDAITNQLCGIICPSTALDGLYITAVPYADPMFKPTLAEPDRNNDIWVSYTNQLCSCLYKYLQTNLVSPITVVALPSCSCPMDMVVDYYNNLWVTLQYLSGTSLSGTVCKIDGATYNIISSISAVHPEYITLDVNNEPWYTSDYNTVTHIVSTTSHPLTGMHYKIGTNGMPTWFLSSERLDYNCLEGIACDSYNRVYIINSLEDKLYMISGGNVNLVATLPSNKTIWYNDSGLYTGTSTWAKSLQAFGDWTGFKWVQKYVGGALPGTTVTKYITGQSNVIDIDEYKNFEIRRMNESFNASNQIHEYAIAPHIHDMTNFFDYIIKYAYGTAADADSIGRKMYEKTANFVPNHSDIDTCNINQLYSLANKVDVPIDDYKLNFPSDLSRIMDIISVNQQTLWGSRCRCNLNITNTYTQSALCDRCNHTHYGNRGNQFDASTYMVSAYKPFIIKNKCSDVDSTYTLLTPPLLSGVATLSTYSLNSNANWVIPDEYVYSATDTCKANSFYFYDYINVSPCQAQIAGVINWEDQYTTLAEQNSSIDKWYGEGEVIEKILNYILHMGLQT